MFFFLKFDLKSSGALKLVYIKLNLVLIKFH